MPTNSSSKTLSQFKNVLKHPQKNIVCIICLFIYYNISNNEGGLILIYYFPINCHGICKPTTLLKK